MISLLAPAAGTRPYVITWSTVAAAGGVIGVNVFIIEPKVLDASSGYNMGLHVPVPAASETLYLRIIVFALILPHAVLGLGIWFAIRFMNVIVFCFNGRWIRFTFSLYLSPCPWANMV